MMHHYFLTLLFIMMSMGLSSCGKKHEKTIKHIPAQETVEMHVDTQAIPDPFANLSLDDIRNNIEFFDTKQVMLESSATSGIQQGADECEARLADIAIPFGAQLLNQYANYTHPQHQTVLGYASTMSMDDVVAFYTEQMETLGWRCMGHIAGYEQLLLFERPGRLCNVVIRSLTHPTHANEVFTKIVLFLRTS